SAASSTVPRPLPDLPLAGRKNIRSVVAGTDGKRVLRHELVAQLAAIATLRLPDKPCPEAVIDLDRNVIGLVRGNALERRRSQSISRRHRADAFGNHMRLAAGGVFKRRFHNRSVLEWTNHFRGEAVIGFRVAIVEDEATA